MIFGHVNSVGYGCHQLLRSLHNDAMRRFREAPRDERERYAEQAARYRDMMDQMDVARLVTGLSR